MDMVREARRRYAAAVALCTSLALLGPAVPQLPPAESQLPGWCFALTPTAASPDLKQNETLVLLFPLGAGDAPTTAPHLRR